MSLTSYSINRERTCFKRVKSYSEKHVPFEPGIRLKYDPPDPFVLQLLRNIGTVEWRAITGYRGFQGVWTPNEVWVDRGYGPCSALGETENACLKALRKAVLGQVKVVAERSAGRLFPV